MKTKFTTYTMDIPGCIHKKYCVPIVIVGVNIFRMQLKTKVSRDVMKIM